MKPLPPLARLPLLALGVIALVVGVLAGLARLGVAVPAPMAAQAGVHGALMIAAFLGTVIGLERAVALAMAYGPAVGLELVDQLTSEPSLQSYHLLPSVRGDLLVKLDRHAEARTEFLRAADLAQNARERELLLARANESFTAATQH